MVKHCFLSFHQHMMERYSGQLQVLKMYQIFVILSHDSELDPCKALFVSMDNMWMERFGNYDCLVYFHNKRIITLPCGIPFSPVD